MELTALQTLSPTLLQGMLEGHKSQINKGQQVFNSEDISLDAWFKDETTQQVIRIQFDSLPDELRQAIHNYTTRLCAEKLLIETVLGQ